MASTVSPHVRPDPRLYSALCCSEAAKPTCPGCLRPGRPSPWTAWEVPPADCQQSCCVWPSPQPPGLLHRAPAPASPSHRPGSLLSYCAAGGVRYPRPCSSLLWRSDLRGRRSCPGPQSCCAAWCVRGLRSAVHCSGSRHPGWTRCCSGLAPTVKTWTCEEGVEEEHLYDKERLKHQKSGRKEGRGIEGC